MGGWRRAAGWTAAAAGAALLGGFAIAFAQARRLAEPAQVAAIGTARVEALVWPADFDKAGGAIGPDFGVGPDGRAALAVGGRVFATRVSAPARPPLVPVQVQGDPPSSLAVDEAGDMLGVAGGFAGVMDEDGRFTQSLPLPYPTMRVAPSSEAGVVFLYGGAAGDDRLYGLIDDGRLQVLLQSSAPIVGAAGGRDAVYAATPTAVLRLKAGEPDILFRTPPDFKGPIRSIAVGPDGLIFFSTATRVYALLGPNALSIVNDAGGSLRVRDRALYVLDPRRRLLLRVSPATAQLVSKEAG